MRTTATATAPLTADATTECQPDAHVLQLERVEESTTEVHRMNATATNIMMPSITAEVLGPVAERPVQRTNRRRALRSAARPTPTICRRSSAPSMPPPIAPHRAGQLAASKPSTRAPTSRSASLTTRSGCGPCTESPSTITTRAGARDVAEHRASPRPPAPGARSPTPTP